MKLTLAQVAHDVRGTIARGEADALLRGVSTDTRTVKHGDLFVALRGPTSTRTPSSARRRRKARPRR